MKTDNCLRQLTVDHRITKAAGRLFHSIAISSQLNAVPYLRHMPWQLLQQETALAVLNSRIFVKLWKGCLGDSQAYSTSKPYIAHFMLTDLQDHAQT